MTIIKVLNFSLMLARNALVNPYWMQLPFGISSYDIRLVFGSPGASEKPQFFFFSLSISSKSNHRMRVTHTLEMIYIAVADCSNFAPVPYRLCRCLTEFVDGRVETKGERRSFVHCCLRGPNGITLVFHLLRTMYQPSATNTHTVAPRMSEVRREQDATSTEQTCRHTK